MRKILKKSFAFITLAFLAFTLIACSKYGALKSAFADAGYTENENFVSVATSIKEELEKEEYAVELHLLTKENGISSVLIVEFKTTKELVEAYKESETIKGLVKDIKDDEDIEKVYTALEEAGYVKGNCIAVPMSILYVKEITDVVKSVK